jgi:hypothetical protein
MVYFSWYHQQCSLTVRHINVAELECHSARCLINMFFLGYFQLVKILKI